MRIFQSEIAENIYCSCPNHSRASNAEDAERTLKSMISTIPEAQRGNQFVSEKKRKRMEQIGRVKEAYSHKKDQRNLSNQGFTTAVVSRYIFRHATLSSRTGVREIILVHLFYFVKKKVTSLLIPIVVLISPPTKESESFFLIKHFIKVLLP